MKKILIVEDDQVLATAYKNKFSMEGFITLSAGDGREALNLAEAEKPDLILLDILMPNMDGFEFLREYDVKNKHPEVKIIVFTNWANADKMAEAINLGAIKYLTKANVGPNELISVVKDTIKG